MKRISSFLRIVAVAAPLAAAALPTTVSAQVKDNAATHPFGRSQPIPGRYIVVFKPSVGNSAAEAAAVMRGLGGQVHHTYSGALKGFAASIPDAALPGIRNNPNVQYIEQDQVVSLQQASPQNQVTWNLDRIDQADLPLDTQYHFNGTGASVYAFVVDTGLRADHVEFTGRVRPGYNVIADGNGTNDCNGHGTHVAGILGGTTWGVAKGVNLIPVRVLGCTASGPWSDVIAGIDWVANSTLRPAVANVSIGGGASPAVDAAVAGAVARGVTMVVAAGNANVDACSYSPAREPSALTVGATIYTDARAIYSNTGPCLDLFAPGSGITAASNADTTSSKIMSGTSMASPHVAGVAALTLQANPTASPAAVAAAITSNATPNRVLSAGSGSPNLLLYSLGSGSAVPALTAQTVAFVSMVGKATKTGGNWKASAVVTVRNVNSGATVANATVAATFLPGGNASCVTGPAGSCTLTSGSMKSNSTASTTLSGTGISGSLMNYDPTQNSVTQIVISRP